MSADHDLRDHAHFGPGSPPVSTGPIRYATRGVAVDGRYGCFYCSRGEAMREAELPPGVRHAYAVCTIHDRRGCYHLCWSHALWRSTTSMLGGHSNDCPHKGIGRGP